MNFNSKRSRGGVFLESDVKINISGLIDSSAGDGPGIRSILFFQGCSVGCPGCHNAGTHPTDGGVMMDLDEVMNKIEDVCFNKKITISGGEPMEQLEGLFQLLERLRAEGYEICLYTSYTLKRIPFEILNYLRYLKSGPFIETLKQDSGYYGSTNQRFFEISSDGASVSLREFNKLDGEIHVFVGGVQDE